MFLFAITISALLGPALTRPQESAAAPIASNSGSTPIPIISQTEEINPDGSFKFSYETGNGIKVEENGYLKDGNESATDRIQVIQGSVSYTDSDGKLIHLKYIADENGFQPEGDHLPTSPPLPGAAPGALRALSAESQNKPVSQPSALPAQKPSTDAVVQPAAQPISEPSATTTPQAVSQPNVQSEPTTETQVP